MSVWSPLVPTLPKRDLGLSLRRGFLCRCPQCGRGPLFAGYLKVQPSCSECSEDFTPQRADDAPPYFTIALVGHIVVPLVLIAQTKWFWPDWVHLAVWLPLTLVLTLLLLRPVKGMVVALQWALYMHGFDPAGERDDPTTRPLPIESA